MDDEEGRNETAEDGPAKAARQGGHREHRPPEEGGRESGKGFTPPAAVTSFKSTGTVQSDANPFLNVKGDAEWREIMEEPKGTCRKKGHTRIQSETREQ